MTRRINNSHATLFLDNNLKIIHSDLNSDFAFCEQIKTGQNLEDVFTLSPDLKQWLHSSTSGSHTGLLLFREDEYAIDCYRLASNVHITAIIYPVEDAYSAFSSLALMDAAAIIVDKNANIISSSAMCRSYFDTDLLSKIGLPLWTAIPELKNALEQSLNDVVSGGNSEFIYLDFPPTAKSFEVRLRSYGDNYVILFSDTTEKKSLETKSRNNEVFLSSILNHIFDGIVVIDTSGIVLLANKAIENISGFEISELVGQNISIMMNDSHGKMHNDYIKRGADKTTPHVVNIRRTLSLRHKSGKEIPIDIAITELQLADKLVFIGSIRDITKQLEQEKRISELARFPEENWNPVVKIEESGKITYANPSADILLAYWGSNVGQDCPLLYQDVVRGAISSGDPQLVQIDCGDTIYDVLFSPAQEFRCVYVHGNDITKNVRYEKELLEHRTHLEEMIESRTKELAAAKDEALMANHAKSAFLANMSHEMRTPLTAIVGYAETLLDDDIDEKERLKAADTIIRSSLHLKEIISDVLDISKIEAEKLELEQIETDTLDILNDIYAVMQPLATEKSLEFRISFSNPVPKIFSGDPTRIKQILINLCSNAIKFTDKGSITIDVSTTNDAKLQFSVSDTGVGIAAESLDRIFDKFAQADSSTTRQFGGTGLGLSLSRQLAIMMGGNLSVQSQPNAGSCFTVIIDPGKCMAETVDTFARQQQVISTTDQRRLCGRVLLVEDTPALQDLVTMLLRKNGIEPDLANNGKEGLEMASTRCYDMIFMDIQMPEMDGIKATELLRQRECRTPIVAMTANATKRDQIACFDAGFNDFLSKPIDKQLLRIILEKYLSKNDQDCNSTLKSLMLDDEPEMLDLVKKFVDTLPSYQKDIQQSLEKQDWESLQALVHKLKGLGGGYGYPLLTEISIDIEDILHKNEYELIEEKIRLLNRVFERIIAGINSTNSSD